MRKREEHPGIPATDSGPRPADFPLGSVESRAAVRAMINRRAAQEEKAAKIYRASWVTEGRSQEPDYIILDRDTGLPVSTETTANGTRSATVLQQDEEPWDATTKTPPAQTGKAEVVPRKKEEEYEI